MSISGIGKNEVKIIKKVNLKVIKLLYAEVVDNYTFEDYKQYRKYKALYYSRKERFSSGILDWRGKKYYFKADFSKNDKKSELRKFYIYDLDQTAMNYIDRSHKCYQKYVGFDKDFDIENKLPSSSDAVMRTDDQLMFFYFEAIHPFHSKKPTLTKNSQKVGFFYYEFPKKKQLNANSNV